MMVNFCLVKLYKEFSDWLKFGLLESVFVHTTHDFRVVVKLDFLQRVTEKKVEFAKMRLQQVFRGKFSVDLKESFVVRYVSDKKLKQYPVWIKGCVNKEGFWFD
jgi:hypothetical protein